MKVALLSATSLLLVACQSPASNRVLGDIATDEARLPSAWQVMVEANTLPGDWSVLFDDAQLRDYLAIAEANNLDLKQAEARVRQSEASLRQSRVLLGPTVNADLSATGLSDLTDFDQTSDRGSVNASGTWNPDIFGVNRATIRQAEAQLDVQRARTARLRRAILAQTARSYFQIIEADQQLGLAQENLTFLDETKRVSEARFEAGDIARSDLALAELEYENAVAGLRNQEFAARSARRALSIILGDFGSADLEVSERLPNDTNFGLSALPAELLESRYDVRAARAAVKAELEAFDATRKANWPSLRLSGRVGSSGADLSDLFDPDFYIASLTASLGAVMFDSGRNAAQIELAEARIDAALAAYAATVRGAVFDVNDAFDQSVTLRQALEALERGRASAEEALALEQIKFDLGETILLDVLTVQRRVNAIRGARISTERRLLDAQIDAYLALGDAR
ncbi:MAG: TolC family protein [Hyphomonadaceae bacterium]|nr:TolC family protein [Hyphomonadaceae bacterium]